MIAEPVNVVLLLFITGIISVIIVIVGYRLQKKLEKKESVKTLAIAILICFIALFGILVSLVDIENYEIGIDEQGVWYESGVYFVPPFTSDIEILELYGSFPISEKSEVTYRLSPNEAENLGKDFQEKIRKQMVVQETKSETVLIIDLLDYPKGVNLSHFEIVARFTPSFYFTEMTIGARACTVFRRSRNSGSGC
jgi:hypothetical protein